MTVESEKYLRGLYSQDDLDANGVFSFRKWYNNKVRSHVEGIKMELDKAYDVIRMKIKAIGSKIKRCAILIKNKVYRGVLKLKWGLQKLIPKVKSALRKIVKALKSTKLPKRGVKVPYKSGLEKAAYTVAAMFERTNRALADGTITIAELKAISEHLNLLRHSLRVDVLIMKVKSYIDAWEDLNKQGKEPGVPACDEAEAY